MPCPISNCTTTCARRSDLKRHVANFHDNLSLEELESESLMYYSSDPKQIMNMTRSKIPCELCSSNFTQRHDLKRHILTFHKDSPLAVEIENPTVSEIDKLKVKCLFCESTFTRRSDR